MQKHPIRSLGGVALAALLLFSTLPAAAQDTPAGGRFDLDLEAALVARGSTFTADLGPDPVDDTVTSEAASLSASELRAEAWTVEAEAEEPSAEVRPATKKGVGRWLKKHWYVPVLAAVALGAALDNGDGDASGEED